LILHLKLCVLAFDPGTSTEKHRDRHPTGWGHYRWYQSARVGWACPDGFPSHEGRHLLGGVSGVAARGWRSSPAHGGRRWRADLAGMQARRACSGRRRRIWGRHGFNLGGGGLECCRMEFLVAVAGYLRAAWVRWCLPGGALAKRTKMEARETRADLGPRARSRICGYRPGVGRQRGAAGLVRVGGDLRLHPHPGWRWDSSRSCGALVDRDVLASMGRAEAVAVCTTRMAALILWGRGWGVRQDRWKSRPSSVGAGGDGARGRGSPPWRHRCVCWHTSPLPCRFGRCLRVKA
jgi:hypothetical protein